MHTYEAAIRRALKPEQDDLIRHEEHCSADPARLAAVGVDVGDQVRVTRADDEYALYTVSEPRTESPDNVVRMGKTGRERLGTDEEFTAVLDTDVPRSSLSDEDARVRSEFVERLHDDGVNSSLIVLAPHGGDIEPHTDDQAARMAARLGSIRASVWLCRGYRLGGDATRHWHVTSDDISPNSFPALDSVFRRGFAHAVSFHGFSRDEILVGGAALDDLKQEIASRIRSAVASSQIAVNVAEPGDPFSGEKLANIVNRITANRHNGIQIEQSLAAREQHGLAIADAVADVYDGIFCQHGVFGDVVE